MPGKNNVAEQEDDDFKSTSVWDDWLEDFRKISPEVLENLEND